MTVQSDQGDDIIVQSDQGSQDGDQGESQSTVTVAGRTYTNMSELAKDYESLQKKFTQKSQSGTTVEDPKAEEAKKMVEAMMPFLKEAGIATREDLTSREREKRLEELTDSIPALAGKTELLKVLQEKHPDKAIEDIVEMYNLAKKDKIAAAKGSGDFIGTSNRGIKDIKPEDFANMTSEQLAAWEKKQGIRTSGAMGMVKDRTL